MPRITLLPLRPIHGPLEHSLWHLLSRKQSVRVGETRSTVWPFLPSSGRWPTSISHYSARLPALHEVGRMRPHSHTRIRRGEAIGCKWMQPSGEMWLIRMPSCVVYLSDTLSSDTGACYNFCYNPGSMAEVRHHTGILTGLMDSPGNPLRRGLSYQAAGGDFL